MALTVDDITRISKLARIKVSDADKPGLAEDLSGIFGWIDQLDKVDTKGIAKYTDVLTTEMPDRPDAVTDGNCVDDILANAPEAAYNMFVVPKVVE